jgi:SNF2 family DNA or RNA helicase
MIVPREDISYLPHQLDGIRWMLHRESDGNGGGILADDMGLGKTFQIIGLLKNSPFLRTLIVCPPVLLDAWADELRACSFSVSTLLPGSPVWSSSTLPSVWLTTYPKLSLYFRSISALSFERVVLDEGHCIRNAKTSRFSSCFLASAAASCRWIVSATPVQNKLQDWQNLCIWLRFPLSSSADDIMLRRTMAALRPSLPYLPPPPVVFSHDLRIPSSTEEGILFRSLCDFFVSAESASLSGLIMLERYMRIQQFLVHPQLYILGMRDKFPFYNRPDWNGDTTKWSCFRKELLSSILSSVPTLVFCQFHEEIERVVSEAEGWGADVFTVRGGTSSVGHVVSSAAAAVRSGRSVVVVVQISAGGCGLNLQFCRRVLFLSSHWNPAVVHQAVGRSVRIGQSSVVELHFFRVVNSVLANIDLFLCRAHRDKISISKGICSSLYEGFPLDDSDDPMPVS